MPERISKTDLILREDGAAYHLGLLPAQIPDIILTVGDPERVPFVSRYFDVIEEKIAHREFVSHIGRVGKRALMVISSGMGTDNVEILMTELDALVNIDYDTRLPYETSRRLTIIRLGTSGSLQPDIPVDSMLVSQTAFGLDTLMQFYDYTTPPHFQEATQQMKAACQLSFEPYAAESDSDLLSRFEPDFLVGNTLTCPGFYAPQGRHLRLSPRQDDLLQTLMNFRFSGKAVTNLEMETAGYYALGTLLEHRMLSLNAILAHRPSGKFSSNPMKIIDRIIERTFSRIENL
ncbi:MAG: nucleoside phosphorylase [Cyclobacteriaceae bacterium]